MINGAHSIIYSSDPEADRVFVRDVLGFPHVDVGGGWLIYGLPPSELAFHPAETGGSHELFLMCNDINEFIAAMKDHDVACSDIQEQRWGRITGITLPSGARLRVYQPLHERPAAP